MNEKNTFVAWLGYNGTPDFLKSRTIGGFVGVVLCLVLVMLTILALLSLAGLLKSTFGFLSLEPDKPSEDIRNIGLMFAAIVGAPFIVWRSFVAHKQANVAEQGLITDRINKAVEGLGAGKNVKRQRRGPKGKLQFEYLGDETNIDQNGNRKLDYKKPVYEEVTVPNIEVRIGAIYSLERIAKDSLRDHVQIMEILCSYIRRNSSAGTAINLVRPNQSNFENKKRNIPVLRSDISTALTVIGRRTPSQRAIESDHPLGLFSLHDCNLQRMEGNHLDFSGINFSGSWLSQSIFYDCNFTGCHFENSTLDEGAMIQCTLDEIYAPRAVFKTRKLPRTTFIGAYLFETNFDDSQILRNLHHGGPTDFSYANIMKASFENVPGYNEIENTPLVFSEKNSNIETNADWDQIGIFETIAENSWFLWKKSLGYTSKKIKP